MAPPTELVLPLALFPRRVLMSRSSRAPEPMIRIDPPPSLFAIPPVSVTPLIATFELTLKRRPPPVAVMTVVRASSPAMVMAFESTSSPFEPLPPVLTV